MSGHTLLFRQDGFIVISQVTGKCDLITHDDFIAMPKFAKIVYEEDYKMWLQWREYS